VISDYVKTVIFNEETKQGTPRCQDTYIKNGDEKGLQVIPEAYCSRALAKKCIGVSFSRLQRLHKESVA